MPFLDSHVHPQAFEDGYIDQLRQQHIGTIICNSAQLNDWPVVMEFGHNFSEVVPFVGIHPWYAQLWNTATSQLLQEYICANKVQGIGEIGLDRACQVDMRCQEDVFLQQLDIAAIFDLPVAIHCVRCWGRIVDILESLDPCPTFMIHGYRGSLQIMERFVRLGGFISFSSLWTEAGQDKMRHVFLETPLKHLLLETDAPCKQSEISPAHFIALYHFSAAQRNIDLSTFSEILYKNGQIFTHS